MMRNVKRYMRPEFDRSQFSQIPETFGWRKSVHSGWFQCAPGTDVGYNDWPFEIAEFITKLGEEDSKNQVRVCAVQPGGRVDKEHFVRCDDFDRAQRLVIELTETHRSLMFDPVVWVNGTRKNETRFGWVTIAGASPFHLYPEPVIFWEVGSHAYQALVPWHRPMAIEESCKVATMGSWGLQDAEAVSRPAELLYLPGSLIHSKTLPSFTATVVYDAFSVTEVSEPGLCWAEY